MYRSDARRNLDLPPMYTREDIQVSFRARARLAHPDAGGDPAAFMVLVESRDVLMETLRLGDRVIIATGPSWWRRVRRPMTARLRRVV